MLSLEGYRVHECLHETSHSEVYSGTRESDGLRVVLKLYRGAQPEGALSRASREFELLQRVHHEGVVRPVELRAHADRHVLIVERVPGYPLSRYAKGRKLAVREVLAIALGITRSLTAVHEARVIHKDLKLGNILIDPERLRTCLIDFGISSEFGRAERSEPPLSAEGTMRYMAPEQTGRTALGVDFRTDLYSLGVILYELFTGRPPFRTTDALALIHAHLAFQPKPIVEIDASLPLTLSRIVAKLLEKDPELRYQTALGLAADLEQCQKQLLAQGEIDDELVLGSEDASDRLRFPNKIYGRDRECGELRAAFERVSQGGVELVLLAGPTGIGKSALPATLQERLAQKGAYLTQAKFDPDLRERPYSGFATAFTAWVDQILPERKERREMWAEEIRASVGAIGQVLVGLAPNLAYVVEDFPAVPTLSAQEARERLGLAVVRFLRAVARPAHPFVLFLDDLQWADAGSLFLLGALLRSTEPGALLVIGGFRDNEVGPEHPLARLVQELEGGPTRVQRLDLAPLRLEDTTAMLAEALGRRADDVEWLARRVGPKSQHNPLLVRRLMFHLWDRNLIRYEHGRGWQWDERSLTEAEITDDAAAMVAMRIDSLAKSARELIKTASLIGTVFEVEVLVELSGVDRLDVLQQLMSLVDQGLVTPCRDGFKFVHDRLREAAQSRLGSDERAVLHHRAARLLLERTPPERLPALSFQLAEHLSGALDRLDSAERPRAIEILHLAGRLSLEKGVAATASHYLGLARSLVCEADWTERFALAFEVTMQSAEAAFQRKDFALSLAVLAQLDERPLAPIQRARTMALRISVCWQERPADALDLVLGSLAHFGVRFPRTPSLLRLRLELWRTYWILRGPLDGRTFPPGPMSNMSWLAPALIISAGAAPMVDHSTRLVSLSIGYILRCYRWYGLFRNPAAAFAGFSGPLFLGRDLKQAQRFGAAAEYWAERENEPPQFKVRTQFAIHLLHSWNRSRRSLIESFQRTAEAALEVGNVELAQPALHQHVALSALCGEAIPTLLRRVEAVSRSGVSGGYSIPEEGYRRVYRPLLDPQRDPLDWQREGAAIEALVRRSRSGILHIGVQWVAVLCLLGRFDAARAASERLWPRILNVGALGSPVADYVFFRGLCHAVGAEEAGSYLERRRLLRTLRVCLRWVGAWARVCPDFVHMTQLLRAESTRARGRPASALREYQDAAQLARKAGYVHHAALCQERRSSLLERMRRGTEAEAALSAAAELYQEWGAQAKVRQLKGRKADAVR